MKKTELSVYTACVLLFVALLLCSCRLNKEATYSFRCQTYYRHPDQDVANTRNIISDLNCKRIANAKFENICFSDMMLMLMTAFPPDVDIGYTVPETKITVTLDMTNAPLLKVVDECCFQSGYKWEIMGDKATGIIIDVYRQACP